MGLGVWGSPRAISDLRDQYSIASGGLKPFTGVRGDGGWEARAGVVGVWGCRGDGARVSGFGGLMWCVVFYVEVSIRKRLRLTRKK